jgi:iron complex transport system permease protein
MKILILVLSVALALAFAASLFAGRVWISPAEFFSGNSLATLIVLDIRLPRTLLALLMGASLGLSGAVLQGFTRNPLAEPGLLGVTTGAALGAVIAIYFGVTAISLAAGPLFGLLGALAASTLTFALGRGGGTIALILAGAAVSSLAAAFIALALNFAPNPYAAYEIMNWLLGSLADKSWSQCLLVLPFVVAGCGLLAFTGRALDALSLGEAQAKSLGIDFGQLRILVVAGTALAVGAVTSVTGSVGFIGLVAPHLARPFAGHQPGRILAPAALFGALLLVLADIAVREIHLGPEIKLGVLTALIGAPFFFWLVLRLPGKAP